MDCITQCGGINDRRGPSRGGAQGTHSLEVTSTQVGTIWSAMSAANRSALRGEASSQPRRPTARGDGPARQSAQHTNHQPSSPDTGVNVTSSVVVFGCRSPGS